MKPRYFCYDKSSTGARTVMESQLMETAEVMYLNCIIADPFQVVAFLQAKQERLLEENKRLKKVNVYFSDSSYGQAWIHFGSQYLLLKKIREDSPTL